MEPSTSGGMLQPHNRPFFQRRALLTDLPLSHNIWSGLPTGHLLDDIVEKSRVEEDGASRGAVSPHLAGSRYGCLNF